MKLVRPFILGAALVAVTAVRADVPFDAGKFGHMKAVLDVCGRLAPRQASGYLLEMKSLIADASRATVAEAVKTDEYQQAYQSAHSELSGLAPEEQASACRDSLAAADSTTIDRSRGDSAGAKSAPSGDTAAPAAQTPAPSRETSATETPPASGETPAQ